MKHVGPESDTAGVFTMREEARTHGEVPREGERGNWGVPVQAKECQGLRRTAREAGGIVP